jgi:hypothetical protein
MKSVTIKFSDPDYREISKRAFELNLTEAEWIYERIQVIIQEVE